MTTCIDLRPWAKANRYRWRYEESYLAEKPENRGDDRWFIEVLCRYGLIYPKGGNILLAYSSRGMKHEIAEIEGVEHHQWDDDAEVFRFPADRLDDVAAILKPKRLPGSATLTAKQRENLERHAFQGGKAAPESTPECGLVETDARPLAGDSKRENQLYSMTIKRPKKTMTIIDAIADHDVFGGLPAFSNLDTWTAWLVWLKSVFALPMDGSELDLYRQCTGRENPPSVEPHEVFTICGRRGGKSFISALTAVYLACFKSYRQYLNAGERAAILILARDRDQARIVFNYVSGILHAVPVLNAMIDALRADEIELNNDVIIMVKTSDYRAIRGLTVAAAILDEVAFWDSEGASPDHEVLTALRPATSTIPGAKLIAISTPYSQSGSLYEAHKEYYGVDNDEVLIWQADTRTMNPTIDEALIQRELQHDPEGAQAEWLATFRTDLQAAFSVESLERCTIKDRLELPASPIIQYQAFTDPSGGKADAFTLAIGHKSGGKAIVDLVRGWDSPFNPKEVTAEIAEVLKSYGVLNVTGDRFAAEWPISEFREHGVAYEQCEQNKSELYLAFVPVTNSGDVELPDDKRLLTQLRRLERKRGRAGKDTVDHPPRLHDDLANSVAGVSYLLTNAELDGATTGFNAAKHIANELRPVCGTTYIGLTLTNPIASVIGQASSDGRIEIYAALVSQGGLKDHIENRLKPWLRQHRLCNEDWIVGSYEDLEPLDARYSLVDQLTQVLVGDWQPPSSPWAARYQAMLSTLSEAETFTFQPKLQIDLSATLLTAALSRAIDPKEKTVYSAVGNALSLLLNRLADQPKDGGAFELCDSFDIRLPDYGPVTSRKITYD